MTPAKKTKSDQPKQPSDRKHVAKHVTVNQPGDKGIPNWAPQLQTSPPPLCCSPYLDSDDRPCHFDMPLLKDDIQTKK